MLCCNVLCNPLTFANVAAGALHVSKPTHWLESRFHFSFADWHDTDRQNFGALRVMNDDLVSAGNGFGCATNTHVSRIPHSKLHHYAVLMVQRVQSSLGGFYAAVCKFRLAWRRPFCSVMCTTLGTSNTRTSTTPRALLDIHRHRADSDAVSARIRLRLAFTCVQAPPAPQCRDLLVRARRRAHAPGLDGQPREPRPRLRAVLVRGQRHRAQ